MGGRTSLTLFSGMRDMSENTFINVKNRSKTVTALVHVPDSGGEGAILVQGGRFGGWSLYIKDGKPCYTYNFLGLERTTIAADEPLPAGESTICYEFTYDGGGLGKGGTGAIFVDDEKVAEGRIEHTQAMLFSLDDAADVGMDNGTPVIESYGSPHAVFNGRIDSVTVDVF